MSDCGIATHYVDLIVGFILGIFGNLLASRIWDRSITRHTRKLARELSGKWQLHTLKNGVIQPDTTTHPVVILWDKKRWNGLSWKGSHDSQNGVRHWEGRLTLDAATGTIGALAGYYVESEGSQREYSIADVLVRDVDELYVSPRDAANYKPYVMRRTGSPGT